VGYSFFRWTLGLAFGGFTLCPAEGSNSYISLTIVSQPIFQVRYLNNLNALMLLRISVQIDSLIVLDANINAIF